MNDPYDLERFVRAHDADGTFDRAQAELSRGQKTSHWMWFVFPQIAGLGQSPTSRKFAMDRHSRAIDCGTARDLMIEKILMP